jgi:CheY-like chemotaxis protein
MSRTVLFIEPDLDLLGTVASGLRSRGLEVWIANDFGAALERARATLPDCVLIGPALAELDSLEARLAEAPGLAELPRLTLAAGAERAHPEALDGTDPGAIAQRVYALPLQRAAVATEGSEFRGDLAHASIVDLLQLLTMNRQSGTLTLQTSLGSGEVRLVDGDIVDALYRRLEGVKALYRLLGEREGSFNFAPGTGTLLVRRIDSPPSSLLMEGMRQLDEVQRRLDQLKLKDDALIAVAAPSLDAPELVQYVMHALAIPRTADELLDETTALDLDVMNLLAELIEAGKVRRIAGGALRMELADSERIGVLAALIKRATRPGFYGSPRVGIAAPARLLLGMLAALGRLAEAMVPPEAVPAAPIPHLLATLRLPDGVDLDVMGFPLVEAYAPLSALALPGCIAVARLGESKTLAQDLELLGIPTLERSDLAAGDDPSSESVAALVCDLVERAVGEVQ